jgi:two-component system, OmpR family, sensor kinase
VSSLRGRLLASLVGLYVLFAAVAFLINYRQSEANISAFIDGQMHTLAISYSRSTAARPPPTRPVSDYALQHEGAAIVEFWRPDGTLAFSNRPLSGMELQPLDGFHDVRLGTRSWHTYTLRASPLLVQVVTSGDFRRRVIWDSAWNTARPIVYMAPLSVVLLWLVVRLTLRPVDRLVQTLAAQDELRLAELKPARVPRELLPLVDSMNGLLQRMRAAFEAQQRFVQDAAHELRTPLTAVKLQLENLRRKSTAAAAPDLAQLEGGVQRLQRTVEQLLQLARHQMVQPATAPPVPVDLAELLRSAVRDLVPFAESRGIDLGLGEVAAATARLDGSQLRLVLDNLLDNAVRYTSPGGRVDVTLRQIAGAAVVDVTDSGPGIPAADLGRVFGRFYRGSATTSPGSGLGLAIARAAADRCGASVELYNRPQGSGLTARVRVPV